MQTLIFLMQRCYEYYSFDKIDLSRYRLVCVLDKKHFKLFPQSKEDFFAKKYQVTSSSEGGFFGQFSLDYNMTREIVIKEIAVAGSSKNIKLVCVDEMNLLLAAKLRDEFKIPGSGFLKMLSFRDKVIMKGKLLGSGVRIPQFTTYDKQQASENPQKYYRTLVDTVGRKFIVKPTSGASSVFTEVFSDEKYFLDKHQNLIQPGLELEAEEFIEGDVYHCDILIKDGTPIFSVCSRYLNPPLFYLQGHAHFSIPLRLTDPLNSAIKQLALNVLSTLELNDGASHVELFKTPTDELVFLEVAARMPGGLLSINYIKTFGINLYDLFLQIELNADVKPIKPTTDKYSFGGLVPLKAGKIKALHMPTLASEINVEWLVSKGDVISTSATSLLDIAARIFVSNSDYDILIADFERLRGFEFIEVSSAPTHF